jgi:hypothetical protein
MGKSHKFMGLVKDHSYNLNFYLEGDGLWVGKISKSLRLSGVEFRDLDARAVLAWRLSLLAGSCLPETVLIPLRDLEQTPLFNAIYKNLDGTEYFKNRSILATRYQGIRLEDFLAYSPIDQIRNLDQLIGNFVFNLWIGNYDKNDDSYVVNDDLIGYSIDYNLSGPGFWAGPRLALGGYGQSFDMENPFDNGWAICPILARHLMTNKIGHDLFEPFFVQIESLSRDEIEAAFAGLGFFRHSSDISINHEYMGFLIERRGRLRKAVKEWYAAGLPRGYRPLGRPLT